MISQAFFYTSYTNFPITHDLSVILPCQWTIMTITFMTGF